MWLGCGYGGSEYKSYSRDGSTLVRRECFDRSMAITLIDPPARAAKAAASPSMSEMAILQQLSARSLQNGNGAQSNSGKYDCRPESETTETWQRAPRKHSLVGVKHIIAAVETQPFNSVFS